MASIDLTDLLNGILEFFGGIFILVNVSRVHHTQSSESFHWASALFFTIWGFWNIFYYPHLGQWISFAGGIFIGITNTMYLMLIVRYWKNG